jgi:hypothetical protein
MTAKLPTVTREPDGSFSLCIGRDTTIRWRFEPDSNGTLCCMSIDVPSNTRWIDGDRNMKFPVSTLQ